MFIVVLLVLAGGAYYFTTPMERERMRLAAQRRYKQQLRPMLDELRFEPGAFGDALRERTPIIIATPALAALTLVIFLGMLFGQGRLADPETALAWGGSWG